jgi:hypothetical protein
VARLATDIDVVTDLADATAFVRFVPQATPAFVVAVHGKLSPGNLDKIARATGKTATKLGTGTFVEGNDHEPAIALTRDGVMLIGTDGLVRDRLAAGWKPPSHDAGTSLGYLAEAINARPVFALVLTMSQAARGEALGHLGAHNFAADVVARHKAAAFSVFRDGVGWTWVDSSRAGLDAMELVSSGTLDVLRAAQIAPRGFAKIAMGSIDSYRGSSAQLDDLINHKADLMKIVEAYTGDGNFKVATTKDAKALRLSVRATGKSVSEVLPFGLLVPAGMIGYLASRAAPPPPPPPPAVMVEPAKPMPASKPLVGRPPPSTAKPAPTSKPAPRR